MMLNQRGESEPALFGEGLHVMEMLKSAAHLIELFCGKLSFEVASDA